MFCCIALGPLLYIISIVYKTVYLYFIQTDRAAMLDEIVDYVKFLRLQVKVSAFVSFMDFTFDFYLY